MHREALVPAADTYGWTVLATTVPPEVCTDTEILQAYQEQHITVEPGFRWIKNPAAISPVWLEKPERIAALAMLTVVGLLVYAVIQRQVRLYLRDHERHIPGNKGLTATPTAAVVFALFTPVMLVHCTVDNIPSLQVHGVQDYHLLICDVWVLPRAGIKGWQQDKIRCRGPHPLERGFWPTFKGGYKLEVNFGEKCQKWVAARYSVEHLEHYGYNILVFIGTFLSTT